MRQRPRFRSTLLALTLLSALGLLARLPQLDHRVFVDELLHVLAARSFLEHGTLQIDIHEAKPYTRARLFTYAVAGMFRIFGESLVVSRIPALVFGIGLILILFLWVRSVASPTAAWTAAVLLCFNPEAIYLSQWCRFYPLQSVFLLLGAIATYSCVHGNFTRLARVGLALGAMACLALAAHFQILSTVAIIALSVWAAPAVVTGLSRRLKRQHPTWRMGVAVLVGAAAVAVVWSGLWELAWERFQYAAPWADGARENPLYYYSSLLDKYPTLWTLFPLAFLVAVSVYWRPAWFCGCVFGCGFVIQSMAAWKSTRYISWSMPFFFAIIGMAFDPIIRWIGTSLKAALARHPSRVLDSSWSRTAITGALAGALLFAAAGNHAFRETHALILGDEDSSYRPIRVEPDWEAAAPMLRKLAGDSEVVLSSSGAKSLFFLERLDFLLSSQAHDDSSAEIGFAKFFGVRRARTPDALRRIIGCHATGLAIIEENHAGRKVTSEVVDYLSNQAERLPLPPEWRLLVFRWDRPPVLDCSLIPE